MMSPGRTHVDYRVGDAEDGWGWPQQVTDLLHQWSVRRLPHFPLFSSGKVAAIR
jgi:hypothetical protein